jgi:hypothetical protein
MRPALILIGLAQRQLMWSRGRRSERFGQVIHTGQQLKQLQLQLNQQMMQGKMQQSIEWWQLSNNNSWTTQTTIKHTTTKICDNQQHRDQANTSAKAKDG